MQRFSSWEQKLAPDFWRELFRPKDLIRVLAHANSIFSMRNDAKLLARYDIEELGEHTVGTNVIWEPFELGEPIYLGDDYDYPWQYEVDPDWLFIDAIYDKHVDPTYSAQHKIDFQLLTDGRLQFVKKVPTDRNLYISKGRYAGYRIYNTIGNLLNYKRKDSIAYRDSIAPILAAFYLGPTPRLLIAVLNEVLGLPVAKYGDEVVLSVKDNIVETDKYQYDMHGTKIAVNEGDVLYKFQPLADVVELITHKTHPYWWREAHLGLFDKYRVDGPMTPELRDYLMENFLHDVVLNVRFHTQLQDMEAFKDNADILTLFLDALPTRTDIFMGQRYTLEDWDTADGEVMSLNDDTKIRFKTGLSSMYGLKKVDSPMYIYAPDIGRPIFTDSNYNPLRLTLNDYHWHIFDKDTTDNMSEFWKDKPDMGSVVEPNYDKIYLRLTETAIVDHLEIHIRSEEPPQVEDRGIKLELSGESTGAMYSEIPNEMEDKTLNYVTVPGETICGILEMDAWELENLDFDKNGLVVFDGDKGVAITNAFPAGGIPKNMFVRTEYDAPDGTLVDIKYSTDKETWLEIPPIIKEVTGNVYFKVILYASVQKSPTFRRLYVNLTTNES